MTKNYQAMFVKGLVVWLTISSAAVTAITWHNHRIRAVIGMAWGLIVLWVFVGGSLMHTFRQPICSMVGRIQLDWRLKFILFCTLMAMTEEAITTSMTNLAPLFGVKVGEAYITA